MSRRRKKEETVVLDARRMPSINLPQAFSHFFTLSYLIDEREHHSGSQKFCSLFSMRWEEQKDPLNAIEVRQWISDALLFYLKNYYGLLGGTESVPELPPYLSDHPHLRAIESICSVHVISCQDEDAPSIYPGSEDVKAIVSILEREKKEKEGVDECGAEENCAPSFIGSRRSSLPELDLSSLSDEPRHSSFIGGVSLFSCWPCVGRRATQAEKPVAHKPIEVSLDGLVRQLESYLQVGSRFKPSWNFCRNPELLKEKQGIAREILNLIAHYVTGMSVTNGESADAILSKINQSCVAIETLNRNHNAGRGRLLPILETFCLENSQHSIGRETENRESLGLGEIVI